MIPPDRESLMQSFNSSPPEQNGRLFADRIATNLGPIYELKHFGFLGLVSSRETFIITSQASVYIDVGERLTYEETNSV